MSPPLPDGIVLEQSCTNQQYGFQVDYPAGWVAYYVDLDGRTVIGLTHRMDGVDIALRPTYQERQQILDAAWRLI